MSADQLAQRKHGRGMKYQTVRNFFFGLLSAYVLTVSPVAYGNTVLKNRFLQVELRDNTADFTVRDKRTRYTWDQVLPEKIPVKSMEILEANQTSLRAAVRLAGGFEYTLTLTLEDNSSELVLELDGKEMPKFLHFPFPFYPEENADFLLALKSGLLMPVMDDTVFFKNNSRDNFQYYEGHNGSMPFYGLINKNGDGLMRLVETPNDAGCRLERRDGRLINQIRWQPQLGKFGYTRKVRYIFFKKGGYVAMANRFRDYAEQQGMVKTLREKAKENPNVDKLVGAACLWDQDYYNTVKSCLPIAREMMDLGMDRMVFNGKSAWWNNMSIEDIRGVNALGYLSGRYDVYDTFDPALLSRVNANPSWALDAWPQDVVMNKDGSVYNGWGITGKDGKSYYCGMVTEVKRVDYARRRISKELESKPYLARFMDTEGASEWVEDYRPDRMMTRTQCRAGRMKLLKYVSTEAKLVTGTEGLQCFAVPYVDYFEGVGPVEPFRIDLYGENIFENFEPGFEFPPEFAKLLQVSHRYLVPLWDLVFHDCVVVYPRWEVGVANKYPTRLWVEKGILQNVLYGRPPLFSITPEYWAKEEHRQLINKIYKAECPVARKTGYARMINHEFLTADHDVQRTTFDNGVSVTVNFGDQPYRDSVVGELGHWEYKVLE